MDCNPYLGIAASLACGLLGLIDETAHRPVFTGDAYDGEGEIPRGLFDALELFRDARELRNLLGEQFACVYEIVKEAEYNEFLQVISPWEREHLLISV